MRFRAPGGGYTALTGAVIGTVAQGGLDHYHAFADVTGLVATAGSGTYFLANMQMVLNDPTFGGLDGSWGMIVVY